MSVVLQPTMRMGGRIFWAYIWRHLLISFAVGLVAGVVSTGMHFVAPALVPVVKLTMYVATFVIGVMIFGIVFDKRYKHYSVRLVDNASGEALPRHWKHGLRPWWSYTWRCMLISLLVGVPSTLVLAKTFAPEIKLAQVRMECQQLVAMHEQSQATNDTATMQAAEQAFHSKQCPAMFEPPTEEQAAATRAKTRAAQIGMFVGLILGIALQFKIFQIVLRKRYERFHVQVTANEGAAA